jgi:ubiquinol-cytochrome c reductase cytochrome b subunit
MFTKRFFDMPLINVALSHIANYPVPLALTYAWNFGSLAGLSLLIQIISGLFLAMYYVPHTNEAFDSLQHIMRDVKWG